MSLLLAQSGHPSTLNQCPLSGVKWTLGPSCSRTTRGRRIAAKYRQATGATSLVRENRAWARVRRAGWLFVLPRSQPPMQITSNLMAKGRGAYCKGYCHGPLRRQAPRRLAKDRSRGIGRAALPYWRRPHPLCIRRSSLRYRPSVFGVVDTATRALRAEVRSYSCEISGSTIPYVTPVSFDVRFWGQHG